MLRQDDYPHDLAEMEAWVRSVAPAGARVLEIGCGDGALCERLRSDFTVVGADPVAVPSEVVRNVGFEELTGPDAEPYDVVFASVSLHHVHDPRLAAEALRRLTRVGTTLLVREFDRIDLDHEPTLRWWFDRRPTTAPNESHDHPHDGHEHPGHEHAGHEHAGHAHHGHGTMPTTFEAFVPWWRAVMADHVLPLADVKQLIAEAGFEVTNETVSPYLHRWEAGEQHRPAEEAAIAAGEIRAVGRRLVCRRY